MPKTSRRRFAQILGAASAGLPLAPLVAQSSPTLAKALTEVVRAQSGQYLTAEELEQIGKDFDDYATALQRFRDFPLVNSDEPDFR